MIEQEELITRISEEYENLLTRYQYPRPDRLEAILKFWLTNLFVINDKYELPSKRILNIQKWFFNHIQLDHKRDRERHKRKTKKNLKREFVDVLSFIPFFCNSLLPGGQSLNPSFIEKLLSMTLLKKLERVPISMNKKLRDNFFSSISIFVEKSTLEIIESHIPDFFFNNVIYKKLPLKYTGSMSVIFDELLPYNKIFFQKHPPYISGHIHGGFYGEYLKNRNEDLEKSVADKYVGWGLEKHNIIQNRFQVVKTNDKIIKKLFLIGAAPKNILLDSYYDGFDSITDDSDSFMHELKENLDIHYIKHPSIDGIENNFIFQNSSYYSEVDENDISNSLFIFDRPGHTTLYKCIYEGIPFMMILNKEWRTLFKPKYFEFLEFLSSINLLFWHNQHKEFYKEISLYKNGNMYKASNFIKVRNFLEKG